MSWTILFGCPFFTIQKPKYRFQHYSSSYLFPSSHKETGNFGIPVINIWGICGCVCVTLWIQIEFPGSFLFFILQYFLRFCRPWKRLVTANTLSWFIAFCCTALPSLPLCLPACLCSPTWFSLCICLCVGLYVCESVCIRSCASQPVFLFWMSVSLI